MEVVDYLDRGADIAAEADCFVMATGAGATQSLGNRVAALLPHCCVTASSGAKAAVLSPNPPDSCA